MSDLRTLHDAFAELERRADAMPRTATERRRRRPVLVPIAATVAAAASLVVGALWLAPEPSMTPATDPAAPASSSVPVVPADLISRFRVVLGGTATIEVTTEHSLPFPVRTAEVLDSQGNPVSPGTPASAVPPEKPGAVVAGTLTSAGHTGSFVLTRSHSDAGPGTWCRNPGCEVTRLPDGSEVATETLRPGSGAVAHMASVVRPDGTLLLLRVSNQEDPNGAAIGAPGGRFLSSQPPLNAEQLKEIVTSGKW